MFTKHCGSAATRASRRLILATAVAALISGAAVAADDGESKTLLKNSYQQFGNIDCTYAGYCGISFPATTDTETHITSLSCIFVLPVGTTIGYAQVGTQNFNPRSFVQPFYYGPAFEPGLSIYGINASTDLFVSKGDIPIAVVTSNGGAVTGFQCTISGYHS
jgi:hypothetical protein